jgi:hypothetical protein
LSAPCSGGPTPSSARPAGRLSPSSPCP